MPTESWIETTVVDLLAGRNAAQAIDFVLAYSERRTASWADAARDAAAKAASEAHLPQARGQFRHQYGETAMGEAARAAKAGCRPMVSARPGGAFMIARVGRFGLAGVTVRHHDLMPRRSVTRSILGARNHDIDPQRALGLEEGKRAPTVTELAYFGCMLATPCRTDPSVPAELLYAVPDSTLTRWLLQMPLHRLLALLQDRLASGASGSKGDAAQKGEPGEIEDIAFPKFRLPKPDEAANEDSPGD